VPLFEKQRKSGRITVTDKRMTRFWITLEQGVRFVISSIERMHGGEVFIPKLPSMNILDLAGMMAPECKIDYVGIRPGEKLHESMISEDEARQAIELEDRYIIRPAHPWWSTSDLEIGKPLPEGFSYSSNTNTQWLTKDEMQQMLDSLEK
jgi:UDP-N-acetylglucosamine 4,6-dehydratase